MLSVSETGVSFLVLLLLLALAQGAGLLLQILVRQLCFRRNPVAASLGLFWNTFAGVVLLISLYAIVQTKGVTLFLLHPVLLFFFTRYKLLHVGSSAPEAHARQDRFFFAASVIANFLFYVFALHPINTAELTYVSGDFNIYFRMAQQLNATGIETLNLDPIYPGHFASPYHYGDIWMYALVSRFFSHNPSFVYLVAFSLYSILFVNGVYTFIRQRFRSSLNGTASFLYLLLFGGLCTGFSLYFPRFIVPSADAYTLSVMNWSKVLVPSSMLTGLLLLGWAKEYKAMALWAAIGGLAFINALPAIFMTTFLVLTINALRKRISWKEWFSLHLLYVLTSVTFIILLYKVLPDVLSVQPEEAVSGKRAFEVGPYLVTAVKIFIGGLFQVFVLTPFVLLLLAGLFIRDKSQLRPKRLLAQLLENDVLLLISVLLSGLTCWAILHPFAVDAVQFYTNILAPIYAIVICFIVSYLLAVVRHKVLSVLAVACMLLSVYAHRDQVFFVNTQDKAEWNKLTAYLDTHKDKKHLMAHIQPLSHFRSFFDKNTVYFMPLSALSYYWPDYHNLSLNTPFMSVNEQSIYAEEERKEIGLAPFSLYSAKRQKQGVHNFEQITTDFIREQRIGFITVSADTVLPEYLRPMVKDSVILQKANFVIYGLH